LFFPLHPVLEKLRKFPIALLDSEWIRQKKLIMLEPRRLAARRAARIYGGTVSEKVGQTSAIVFAAKQL